MVIYTSLAILPLSVPGFGGYPDRTGVAGNLPLIAPAGQINTQGVPRRSRTLYAQAPAEIPETPVNDNPATQDPDQDVLEPATDRFADPIPEPRLTPKPKTEDSRAGEKIDGGHVARALFTRGVIEHEPVDTVESPVVVPLGETINLFYFTDIRDMPGETISHHWFHEHKSVARKSFEVGGYRWRVFSSKRLPASMPGRWEVQVKDSRGEVIKVDNFVVNSSEE